MTVGYWDRELIHTMQIKYLADRFDDDPCDTGTRRDREMITLIGMSHSLLWQLIPYAAILGKLGEASNFSPPYIDTEEVANIPYFWPSAIRKAGVVKACGTSSVLCASVFDDHLYHHDIYAPPRFFKYAGQMLKFSLTLMISFYPSATAVTSFLGTSLAFQAQSESEGGTGDSEGDSNPVRPRWQRWIIRRWHRDVLPPLAEAGGAFVSNAEKVAKMANKICMLLAGHRRHHNEDEEEATGNNDQKE